jgi:hypothetical protein
MSIAPAKSPRTARIKPDAVLAGAVELAKSAAVADAEHPSHVGEHLGVHMVAERLAAHTFACTMRGYVGWQWTVTLARVPRGRIATVCEVHLLPTAEAILAPEWLPWSQRLQPGDIGPGDVLPFTQDDPRLVEGYKPTGNEEEDQVAIEELALARARILSETGRDEAAKRWYEGSQGPRSQGSLQSAASCGSGGFLVPLQGALGQVFGVCANAWSPDDGKVVALGHGCGGHSETDVPHRASDWPDNNPIIDETSLESVTVEQLAALPPLEKPSHADDRADVDGPSDTSETEATAQDETGSKDIETADAVAASAKAPSVVDGAAHEIGEALFELQDEEASVATADGDTSDQDKQEGSVSGQAVEQTEDASATLELELPSPIAGAQRPEQGEALATLDLIAQSLPQRDNG